MIEKKFDLFASCISQKGRVRGIIIDFKRKSLFIFPNQILKIIDNYRNKSIYHLFSDYKENRKVLKKYVDYFIENELVLISDELNNFKKISKTYLRTFYVDIFSLELSGLFLNENLPKIIDGNGVICLKIIVKKEEFQIIARFLDIIANTKIQNISLFIEFDKKFITDILRIKNEHPRIEEVIFFNSNKNTNDYVAENIFIEEDDITNIYFRNVSSIENFILDHDYYIESLNHNPMYNRSIHIDRLGNIMKYLVDSESYGNIFKSNLVTIIKSKKFIDFWSISKDKISICRDCEFKYICPDGRIPIKIKSNDHLYFHKSECNYNPYTNEWKNQN